MSGAPHTDEVIADQGSEAQVWVCPECHFSEPRHRGEEVAPMCPKIDFPDDDSSSECGTTLIKGVLVVRETIYRQ